VHFVVLLKIVDQFQLSGYSCLVIVAMYVYECLFAGPRHLKTALRGTLKRCEIVDKLSDDFDELETKSVASDSPDDASEIVVCCDARLPVICSAGRAAVCNLRSNS
jgi:hypothetical protein